MYYCIIPHVHHLPHDWHLITALDIWSQPSYGKSKLETQARFTSTISASCLCQAVLYHCKSQTGGGIDSRYGHYEMFVICHTEDTDENIAFVFWSSLIDAGENFCVKFWTWTLGNKGILTASNTPPLMGFWYNFPLLSQSPEYARTLAMPAKCVGWGTGKHIVPIWASHFRRLAERGTEGIF